SFFMLPSIPLSTLFPYTTLFRSTSKFGFAVFVLAVSSSGCEAGALPRWLVRLGIASVVLMLVSAVALFLDHGVFQFGGLIDLGRSEEHTSELQSRFDLVCRLLLA